MSHWRVGSKTAAKLTTIAFENQTRNPNLRRFGPEEQKQIATVDVAVDFAFPITCIERQGVLEKWLHRIR